MSAGQHDVAIVGGGLTGSTLAGALAQGGLDVAVIEAQPPPAPPRGTRFDLRVSALTRATERILQSLGAWACLPRERLGPFREMHVWDARGGGAVHFDSAELGEPHLGHIVENAAIQHALAQSLDALGEVRWYRPARIEDLRVEAERAVVRLDEGELRARLVVGADGVRSRLRELAGIGALTRDYRQRALVCNVSTARSHRETAWQRFLPLGPLAFLPLPEGQSAVVWSTSPERARALQGAACESFAQALERAFGARLGAITWVGERATFPLRRLRAAQYVTHRVALVGDAAHVIHPLAGQGANLGFLDAATLAQVVLEAARAGRDFGTWPALRRYERWRAGPNQLMQLAMDAFHRGFRSPLPPVRLARNLGLSGADRVAPVKRFFMRHAMGLAGDLPDMARGIPPPAGVVHREGR